MAVTITSVELLGSRGDLRESTVRVAMDNSYPTGGESVPLQANFGLSRVIRRHAIMVKAATGAATADYDPTTEKVLCYTTAGAESANAADLSAAVIQVTCVGYP